MGVPDKKPKQKRSGKKGKKGTQKKATMWGGSPASAMLFQDLANPTNTDNYLDADIPLVANQTSAKAPMTGGSLTSAPVVSAANNRREPGAMLNDYESAMDLKGCGGKAVMTGGSPSAKHLMTGGSPAFNNVMRHVSLPSVLKSDEVTRMVPDYLSLDPAARPVSSQLSGGAINHGQGPLQRQFAMAPENQGPAVGPEGQMLIPQPGEEMEVWENVQAAPVAPVAVARPKIGKSKAPRYIRPSTRRTLQPKRGINRSKRTRKRMYMTGGASGFWGGVAGCGPVNVPNAGNTLSRFFTKSSSCPGPDFYANPPNLGSAGSGYATELPSGAPFPFM
jgi:hypothetical protein